ncbi:MAG: hypothetical protein HPY74_19440 [Firmicutes bacterium]|nr:hypothetical protein [Bacillota bacterium]
METKEYVEYLLKNYNRIKKDIEYLKFELEHLQNITEDETIEALCFKQPVGEKVDTGGISDKTARIALIFRQYMQRMNNNARVEIVKEIRAAEFEIMKLEHYVNGLDRKIRDAIKDLYFNEMTWSKVCDKYAISERTLNRYRKIAVEGLVAVFDGKRAVI